ncbi:MAG: InlB B-repeat-containing protein [Treponema sp.]|nr:InlB B-repeat-containing protein [Treponema sp.]
MKRKNEKFRFLAFFSTFFAALSFIGCPLLDSSDDEEVITNEITVEVSDSQNNGASADETENSAPLQATSQQGDITHIAYLSISVKDEDGNPLTESTASVSSESSSARVALPLVSTLTEFTSFTLNGSTDDGFSWQNLWKSDGTSSVTALSQLNSALIPVSEGFWTFKLIAQKGGVVYTAQIMRQEIVASFSNNLSFLLTLSKIGADEENSTGGVKVSVSYPTAGVSKVTAGLYALDGTEVFAEESATTSNGKATYEKSGITAGTYAVTFRFYTTDSSSGEEILIGTWTEYAGIASGVTSTSTDTGKNSISAFDQTYAITYNWNGGGLATGSTAQAAYTRHGEAHLPTGGETAKNGYTFSGWYGNASFSGEEITEISSDTAGNKSFWAKWNANSYTIRYHKNTSASDTASASEAFTYDKTQSLSTLSSLGWTRTDASFVGWATSSSGTAVSSSNGITLTDGANGVLNLTEIPDGTVDLYAVWKYTVTFAGNKGASHTTAVTGSVSSQSVTGYGTNLTVAANGFTHTGYTFSGWNSKADGTGTTYTAGTAYTFSANTTLYAQWNLNTYTITYNLNSGTNASTNPATYTAETATITLANPTRIGYAFAGWYTGSSFVTQKTQIARGSAGSVTLYAKWTAKTYTVTLNANGGTGGSTSVTATYNSAMPALTSPTRTGYTFQGYYDTSAATGGTQYYTKEKMSATTYTTDGTKTLYARWTANTYTVTISTGWAKGETTTTTVTATYDSALPMLTTTNPPSNHPAALGSFARSGYTLNGFYDAASGGTKYYNADGTSAKTWNKATDTTLYAQWSALGVVLTEGSTSGMGLVDAIYVFSQDLSFTTSTSGDSGITIGASSVSFYIEEGVTVTATGAAGNATLGGGAGIHVPNGRTLNIYGYGTLNATGGKGGNATNGGNNKKTAYITKQSSGDASQSGGGGDGGTGAGGGGAGIGTPGANGGGGGTGGTPAYTGDINGDASGGSGATGSDGGSGASCGTIKNQSTLTVNATAGGGGSAGSGGVLQSGETGCQGSNPTPNYGASDSGSGWGSNFSAGFGGTGGGGGAGTAGAAIGTGGAGGGGGGGGGAGGIDKASGSRKWRNGYAGSGGSSGGGDGTHKDDNGDLGTQGRGGAGGAQGTGGVAASVGSL